MRPAAAVVSPAGQLAAVLLGLDVDIEAQLDVPVRLARAWQSSPRFHMRFPGNHQLRARQARTLSVLYGPNAKNNS